mmetsp:Transcript_28351/g.41707  ORF Transcript_28351/g.41707 Transcript_28351/m.41707 type:complete len:498 (-) Transcript_28351:152-1645(-)|eukprot:CAMPEP_0116009300 /NCGR_PEP_ID=MMETSP0321-20121206/3356_1 /TAXON_ID=163516 /ORGANISM="Leptocylindrus danicus var. danicus, Strain B650" /LENGTH=497 /DNA_ID=CAMNT_0003478247 /DNA_START=160 /DNA_END=1653 /DNA_ORIENTATION=-
MIKYKRNSLLAVTALLQSTHLTRPAVALTSVRPSANFGTSNQEIDNDAENVLRILRKLELEDTLNTDDYDGSTSQVLEEGEVIRTSDFEIYGADGHASKDENNGDNDEDVRRPARRSMNKLLKKKQQQLQQPRFRYLYDSKGDIRQRLPDQRSLAKSHTQHKFETQKLSSTQLAASPALNDMTSSNSSSSAEKWNSDVLKALWKLCRPSNFFMVLVLHALGVWSVFPTNFLNLHMQDHGLPMLSVIVSLLLSSAASMVINDIHDAKSGVDTQRGGFENKPLITGEVSTSQAYKFWLGLNAVLGAVVMTSVEGAVGKGFFALNLVLTYMYTNHVKPVTWAKNVLCACLVSGAPVCSATIALAVKKRSYVNIIKVMPLSSILFLHIFVREMVMDLNDYKSDKASMIKTVPVKYGRQFASNLSFAGTLLMGALAVSNRVLASKGNVSISSVIKVLLAAGGSVSLLKNISKVREVEGSDITRNMAFIDNNAGALMLLASFL